MARAQGINAVLSLKDESVYGTAPSGDWNKVHFIDFDFNPDQKLVADDTLGHGRDPIDPTYDVIDVVHSGNVPVDVRDIGFWLKGLFGAATDAGAGPYTHTFVSGAGALPSRAIEIGFTDIGKYFTKTGAVVGKMGFDFKPSGNVKASVDVIAQNDAFDTSSGAGTPTSSTYKRFSAFTGAITLGGVALAGITDASFTYDNKLDAARVIRSDGLIEGVDPTQAECLGKMTARFENTTLLADAVAGTPVAITLGWTIDVNTSLIFTMPRVFLPREKTSVKGPGGIDVPFSFQAVYDPTATYMLQAVLKNDVASY